MEKKYDECLKTKKRPFRCDKCDKEFSSVAILNRHKKSHNLSTEKFQCDKCERSFEEEWKLNAHIKSHKSYPCDQCDKTFKYQETKEKHTKITHENVKLFCHYFNNDLECPFDEECIFLHEDSPVCKYGELCERTNCMFKHQSATGESDDADDDSEDVEDVEDDTNYETDKSKEQTSETVAVSEPYLRKCTLSDCDNICRGEQGLTAHLKSKHGIPTWC